PAPLHTAGPDCLRPAGVVGGLPRGLAPSSSRPARLAGRRPPDRPVGGDGSVPGQRRWPAQPLTPPANTPLVGSFRAGGAGLYVPDERSAGVPPLSSRALTRIP